MRARGWIALFGAPPWMGGCKVSPPNRVEQRVVVAAEHEITVRTAARENP